MIYKRRLGEETGLRHCLRDSAVLWCTVLGLRGTLAVPESRRQSIAAGFSSQREELHECKQKPWGPEPTVWTGLQAADAGSDPGPFL